MATHTVSEVDLVNAPWQRFQSLIDACFPRPPRDVFERVVAASHRSQRLWLASEGDDLLGLVMLSPHSKGGHLENLAVNPRARGKGIGLKLVTTLLHAVGHEGPGIVSLTTRIPSYFVPIGFQSCGKLVDGSTAMVILLPPPSISDTTST